MGCGSSKKSLPDRPSENDYEKVKSAYRNRRNNRNSGGKRGNNTGRAPKYRTKIDSRVIAKYDIKALIGKGSFSDVLRVENKVTKQPYAVKILRLKTTNTRDLFESELAVLRRVRHPFVIQLIEVFESKDCIYLVMELATGGELYDRIKMKGHLNEKETVHVLRMVLEGVKYLHSIGVTHRDLKPENLLFYHPGHDSKILITDFGFAKSKESASDGSLFTTWCGTPEYIAPEVLWKKPYTNAVDMWAIGVITYVMLSGHLPFAAENTAKLFQQIVRANYSYTKEVWKGVSSGAKKFIDKLLVVDPIQRYSAEEGLRHQWLNSFSSVFLKNSAYMKYSSQVSNAGKSSKSCKSVKTNRGSRGKQRCSDDSSVSASRISEYETSNGDRRHTDVKVGDHLYPGNNIDEEGRHTNNKEKVLQRSGVLSNMESPMLTSKELGRTSMIKTERTGRDKNEKLSCSRAGKEGGMFHDEFPSAAATEGSDSLFVNSGVTRDESNPFLTRQHGPPHPNGRYEEVEMERLSAEIRTDKTGNHVSDDALATIVSGNGRVAPHLLSPSPVVEHFGTNESNAFARQNSANSNSNTINKATSPAGFTIQSPLALNLTSKRLHTKSFASISAAVKSPRLLSGTRDTSFMEKVGQWLEEQSYLETSSRAAESKVASENNFVLEPSLQRDHKKYFESAPATIAMARESRINGDVNFVNDSKRSKRMHNPEETHNSKLLAHLRSTADYDEQMSVASSQGGMYHFHTVADSRLDNHGFAMETETPRFKDGVWKHPGTGRPLTLPPLLKLDLSLLRNQNIPPGSYVGNDANDYEMQLMNGEGVLRRRDRIREEGGGNDAVPNDWNDVAKDVTGNSGYVNKGT